MRFYLFFQLVVFFLLAAPLPTFAQLGGWKYIWGPPNTNPVRPYLEEGKIPHQNQWTDDDWTPQHWIDAKGGDVKAVVDGFYAAGIVTDQYTEDDIPVLEVGQKFLELSDRDKRRVAMFFDHAFMITAQHKVFMIQFHKHDTPIGLFTAQGLQLQ